MESGTSRGAGRGHRDILYHQLNQDDQEQEQDSDTDQFEELKIGKIVRSSPNNKTMALNIHNRRLFLGSFLAVEVNI